MTRISARRAMAALGAGAALLASGPARAEAPPPTFPAPEQHDGAHDFDFLIGDWKAHVRRLPDRLVGSAKWLEYDGVSNHRKLLDSDANFEEFEVDGVAGHLKAQTLRLYSPQTRQWSIYLVDVNKGVLSTPAQVGQFTKTGPSGGSRGEFYAQDVWKGRAVLIRYLWMSLGPKAARMEQAFSADGGKTWETNWVCELSR